MKKVLLSTAAFAAFAVAGVAKADEPALQLGLGGYVSGYAVYTDTDADDVREFDFRKDTEIHLNGEVALDNGITAGAHIELYADRNDADRNANSIVEESYMYLSSSWGRVNFGEEDGIAYLLQVGAPSADDKIDGIRPDIGSFDLATGGTIDYAQDPTGYANKLTYITPVFNGFQAGVSFTPSVSDADLPGIAAAEGDDDAGELENAVEVAARYEGSFDAIDLALGAGYSMASTEEDAVAGAGSDDLQAWNVGANIGFGAFGVGASYVTTNNADDDADTDIIVAGVDYTTGPYKLGLSYLNADTEGAAGAEVDRYTGGVVYEWGPGMTFRGAVQYQEADAAAADSDGYQVTLGTQLNF